VIESPSVSMYDAEDPAKVAGSSSEPTANANCGVSIAKVKGTAAGNANGLSAPVESDPLGPMVSNVQCNVDDADLQTDKEVW